MGKRKPPLSSEPVKRKRSEEHRGLRKKSSTGRVRDVSVVEISDSDVSSSVQTSKAQLSDQYKLCEFPPGGRGSVSVSFMDYKTLERDTYLNDIIIDFYLTYLLHTVLSPEEREHVHVFSAMFYKSLTLARANEEQGLSSFSQKMHSRVKRWTKNVNIFDKKLVIVPICQQSHWYLIIIIKPGQIIFDAESRQNGEPLFLVLDSLESLSGKKSVKNLRLYVKQEWLAKNPGQPEVSFSKKKMKTVRPRKPEQENFTDCGIFLLHYVEKIFNK